jgi:Nickel responsive protein SCO4226-like
MPLYLVEREYAEELDLDDETKRLIDAYNLEHELKWLTSFLSADKKKTYCLYEADDVATLRRHAADLGLPIDAVTEVSEMVR